MLVLIKKTVPEEKETTSWFTYTGYSCWKMRDFLFCIHKQCTHILCLPMNYRWESLPFAVRSSFVVKSFSPLLHTPHITINHAFIFFPHLNKKWQTNQKKIIWIPKVKHFKDAFNELFENKGSHTHIQHEVSFSTIHRLNIVFPTLKMIWDSVQMFTNCGVHFT